MSSSRGGSQGFHYTHPVPNGYRDRQWGNNYSGGQGSQDNSHCSSPRNPFEYASQAEGDLSIPSVYSEPSYEQGEEEDYGAYQDSGYYQPSHSFHNVSQQGSRGSHHSFPAQGRNNQGSQNFPYQDYRYEGANENGVPGGVAGNGGYPPQDNQGSYPNQGGQQPYQGGRGNHGVLTMASHQGLTTRVQGSFMEINIMVIKMFPYGIPSFQNMMGKSLGVLMKSNSSTLPRNISGMITPS